MDSAEPTDVAAADAERCWLAAALAGEPGAFDRLVRLHAGHVRALLRRMGADPAAADDIAQDAFVQAWRRLAEFRGEGGFGGWVARIAVRLWFRRHAREARRVVVEVAAAGDLAEPGAADSGHVHDLDAALALLGPAERLCVTLCHGAGYSHGEIAALIGVPLGTVKSHVRRGLIRLRRSLGE